MEVAMNAHTKILSRSIIHKTKGRAHGPIVRLMSPGDLGQHLKPFVFLDLVTADASFAGSMPLHPHSGIATVTVITDGEMRFEDVDSGQGYIGYGGVEWMRAGGGVWHGKELSAGRSKTITGFQLWLALPPELENGDVDSQYIESKDMPVSGPAHVILGSYEGVQSPVRSPDGINYLLVTLQAGETWTYLPPEGHDTAWLSVSRGALQGIETGVMAVFAPGPGPIVLQATDEGDVSFVIASAVPHPYDLVTGYYSVHTTPQALQKGEAKIEALRALLTVDPNKQATVPVFKG